MKEIAKIRVDKRWIKEHLQHAKEEAGETTASKTFIKGAEILSKRRKKKLSK